MGNITLLDQATIDKIAAGEVVERPSSVVKELVENAIDAKSTAITVEIKDGGTSFIRISDNGCGIDPSDIKTAFLRHSTSKIRSVEDLLTISSLGFRGEALSSISAVSMVELLTKTKDAICGIRYVIEGGKEKSMEEAASPDGTTFFVRNLFYNTPARKKFLKSSMTEAGYIHELMIRLALSHPEISFKFINNGQTKLHSSGNHSLKDVIYQVYGRDISNNLVEIDAQENGVHIKGYIGKPSVFRGNRNFETYFVNGRYIKSNIIAKGIEDAYKGYLMQHQYPFCVLQFEMDGSDLDVNVHPTKIEVRFSDENALFRAVVKAIPYSDYFSDFYGDRLYNVTAGSDPVPSAVSQPGVVSYDQISGVIAFETPAKQAFPKRQITNSWTFNMSTTGTDSEVDAYVEGTDVESENNSLSKVLETVQEPELGEVPVIEVQTQVLPEIESEVVTVKESDEIVNPFYINAKVVGQVLNTYIVLEYGDSVFLLDQHAAHERLMYEQLKKSYAEGNRLTVQSLLIPLTINMSPGEMQAYMNRAAALEKLGFEIEFFGKDSIIIRSVPSILEGQDVAGAIGVLLEKGDRASVKDLIEDEKLYTMACKAAVKGNNALSDMEIDKLLHDLSVTDRPGTCPHGRPIIAEISKREIEKKFKRIL